MREIETNHAAFRVTSERDTFHIKRLPSCVIHPSQHDQRNFWNQQMKLRARELERAQQELFSARMSKIQKATAAQELALHRAQRAVREAPPVHRRHGSRPPMRSC